MRSERIYESYASLWGELMFVMHDPDHLRFVNRGRADWFENLGIPGRRVLDLGAGNGYFDIEIGRRGFKVVAVDQVGPVIEAARSQVVDEDVEFLVSDLREISFDAGLFDAITLFGVVGLMSVEDDTELMANCFRWLDRGGSLLVDCDTDLAKTETIESQHERGTILWHWTSDPETRTNMLTAELHSEDGKIIGLRDPIDPARGAHEGLHRYIYPKEQLTEMLSVIGFDTTGIGHYVQHVYPDTPPSAYMLKATRP